MPSLIGARVPRLEDEPLVRGRGRFVGDIGVPDALHACFLRSPHPPALIRAVAKDEALALPGVHAVLTLDDLAPVLVRRRMLRHSNSGAPLDKFWAFALADGEASYVGEAVVLVLAEDRYVAEDAAAVVAIDYDVMAAGPGCPAAGKPGAPTVRRGLGAQIGFTHQVALWEDDGPFPTQRP